MELSPLSQQARPKSFQPKVTRLYEELFRNENEEEVVHSEGFWLEFFLLKPEKPSLQRRFDVLTPDHLLHFQNETQQLFARAVTQIKAASAPADENALDTLTVVLGAVLAKRYTNPSADIITVLAGLDEVDAVFSEFANAVESIIRTGRSFEVRQRAIQVALSLTSGAYQTSLVSYFTHRDLFPALMKVRSFLLKIFRHFLPQSMKILFIQDTEVQPAFEPFLLLGLLVNYNKFEFRNPYRLRLEDFINEATIQKIIRGVGHVCSQIRNQYTTLQEDTKEGWTLSNALHYIGLGILAPIKSTTPAVNVEDAKEQFAGLPEPEAAILLGTYDFTNANKLFCYQFVACPSETDSQAERPFSAFLSLTSYILHHAYRSPRATLYGLLNLTTLRIIIEDPSLCKHLFDTSSPLSVRLCRQRPPFLPSTATSRPAAASILDILLDAINHNLRRRLDLPLYIACVGLIHRLLAYLVFTRTKLPYHWSLLWQTLLSLLRFLTTYASDLITQHPTLRSSLLDPFLACLALAVAAGDSFLPDPSAYDDLFYKLVEAGHYLPRFRSSFFAPSLSPPSLSSLPPTTTTNTDTSKIDLLITVSTHYHSILESEKNSKHTTLSPREVGKIIRQGYDSLELPAVDGVGLQEWTGWREGEEKGMLKRAARVCVADVARVIGRY